jgi:hypothetical protein
VIVATAIAIIAVLGLAHTFGIGRGLIDRFASARDATALAQRRLEMLSMQVQQNPNDPSLDPGTHGPTVVTLTGGVPGSEQWDVTWVDDALDGTGGADADGNPNDYKRVTVTVAWTQAGVTDHVQIATNFFIP